MLPTAENKNLIQKASDLISQAAYCVALSGAGISTPSGIPDFRSPGSGIWTKYSPMEVATLSAFRYHPDRFYDWLRPFVGKGNYSVQIPIQLITPLPDWKRIIYYKPLSLKISMLYTKKPDQRMSLKYTEHIKHSPAWAVTDR